MTTMEENTHRTAWASRLIGTIHLALGGMALAFFLAGAMIGRDIPFLSPVPIFILLFMASALFQRQTRPDTTMMVWGLAGLDLILLHGVIWSFVSHYDGLAIAALKAPTYAFVFALIALQAVRLSQNLIIFLGAIAFVARLLMGVVAWQSDAALTTSYTSYVTSPVLLPSAEGEILLALFFFTLFLSFAVRLMGEGMQPAVVDDEEELLQEFKDEESDDSDGEPAATPEQVDKPIRVLIAEDNQVNMMVLEKQLASPAFELVMVEDGEEAVGMFLKMLEARKAPDVCLLDIEMPTLSGREVARRIRQLELINRLHKRPIIAITALSGPDQVQMSLDAGMDDHLVKPVSKEKLLTTLALTLNRTIRQV
jgi:CheY-like chemotaxis protein